VEMVGMFFAENEFESGCRRLHKGKMIYA